MKRETRANLIFIVVLIVLMVPGITITIMKRGGKFGRTIQPPPTREALSFIDQTAGIAKHMPRVVPPQIGRFVAQMANKIGGMQRGLTSLVGDGRFAPVMSEKLYFQAIARGAYADKYRVALIGWSGALLPLPKLYAFAGERDGQALAGTLESYETQNMPIELRQELQAYGYILPPDGFIWLIVSFDGVGPIDSMTMRYAEGKTRIDDAIDLRDASVARTSTSQATTTATSQATTTATTR